MNLRDDAQAKSRTFSAWNSQVWSAAGALPAPRRPRLIGRHDEDRPVGIGRVESAARCASVRISSAFCSSPVAATDVIRRARDAHRVVAEFQGELAAPQELVVLPALVVGIGGEAREPVGQLEDAMGIARHVVLVVTVEALVARARPQLQRVVDDVPPVDLEGEALAAGQRRRQVDAQHGLDDAVIERRAVRRLDALDVVAAGKVAQVKVALQGAEADAGVVATPPLKGRRRLG